MENENFEERNLLRPAWQPTEQEQATEKTIIVDTPQQPEPPKPVQPNEENKK